jgi:hypothetical protein
MADPTHDIYSPVIANIVSTIAGQTTAGGYWYTVGASHVTQELIDPAAAKEPFEIVVYAAGVDPVEETSDTYFDTLRWVVWIIAHGTDALIKGRRLFSDIRKSLLDSERRGGYAATTRVDNGEFYPASFDPPVAIVEITGHCQVYANR